MSARPLCIYPWDVPRDIAQLVLRCASEIGAEVIPEPAVAGGHERVLALGALPPFVCNAGLVKDPTNVESIKKALRWMLDPSQPVEHGFTDLNYLEAIFGPGVKDLGTEPIDQKVRFE